MIQAALVATRVIAASALQALDRWEARHPEPCPCCEGTAGLPRYGPEGQCSLCARAPWHQGCGHCWDHCACRPHPLVAALSLTPLPAHVSLDAGLDG